MASGMRQKKTRATIKNESGNGLANAAARGSNARQIGAYDSVSAVLLINVADNSFSTRPRPATASATASSARWSRAWTWWRDQGGQHHKQGRAWGRSVTDVVIRSAVKRNENRAACGVQALARRERPGQGPQCFGYALLRRGRLIITSAWAIPQPPTSRRSTRLPQGLDQDNRRPRRPPGGGRQGVRRPPRRRLRTRQHPTLGQGRLDGHPRRRRERPTSCRAPRRPVTALAWNGGPASAGVDKKIVRRGRRQGFQTLLRPPRKGPGDVARRQAAGQFRGRHHGATLGRGDGQSGSEVDRPYRLGAAGLVPTASPASGGHDGTAKVWEVATGSVIDVPAHAAVQLNGQPENNAVMSLAFSPDGKTLAVGGVTRRSTCSM